MLLTSGLSLLYGENDFYAFIQSAIGTLSIGIITAWLTRGKIALSTKDGFAIVTLTWVVTALASAFPFYLSGYIPNFTDAFFESMSGVTTTGASILGNIQTSPHLENGIESLSHAILFWRSFIQWIGGMGIIVFTIAILPLLGVGGVQLFKAEVPGPVADKISPRVRETAKYLWLIYVGFTLAEIFLLGVSGMDWFDSVCHSLTTMPTGGFSTKNASIAFYDNSVIHYIIIFFMFAAGINFSLHFRALRGDVKSYIKDREFRNFLGLALFVTMVIFISRLVQTQEFNHENIRDSLFQTVSIVTTTGYGSADYELWLPVAKFLLLSLMFIGGMGGSTGGGIKIVRVMLILKYIAMETRRLLHTRAIIPMQIGGKHVSSDVVRNTLGFFLFYIFIFALTTLLLTMMNVDLISSIGASASALGNIGPALGNFGPSDNYALLHPLGKWLLSFCMLLGRLEIFTVMVFLSRSFWKK
ncbi:MAG: TrkH family potassium uptake protein [Candidatus Marinimicrobia bacterium]|nr:TrkH family potassium uptake protein [Candidatus Neomarinimicrobiota bacterium]MBL7022685.1 TrkH family potassium uptake protein [Candidatus Neomarinimicrobiota bacterium]MBL7110082.1 TrkH family potassium uptake protein [Candidatus Neomarinimicrobiota bacterium]